VGQNGDVNGGKVKKPTKSNSGKGVKKAALKDLKPQKISAVKGGRIRQGAVPLLGTPFK
jgi:hypothetical protein